MLQKYHLEFINREEGAIMKNKVKQFRYYGEGNALNYPSSISATKLKSGSIFDDVVPII